MKKRIHLLGIIASIALPINAYAGCPNGTEIISDSTQSSSYYLKWSDESEWNLCLNLTNPQYNNARDSYNYHSYDRFQCGNIRIARRNDTHKFNVFDRNGNQIGFDRQSNYNNPHVSESCTDQGTILLCKATETSTDSYVPNERYGISKVIHEARIRKFITQCRKVVF